MIKYKLAFFLVLPIVCLLILVAILQVQLNTGNTIVVSMRGFDPFDLISGRYLYLRPDWSKTDCSQFANNECPTGLFSSGYHYFLPEVVAPDAEKYVNCSDTKVEMVFVWRGNAKPMVKTLLINGMPWQEWQHSDNKWQGCD